MVAILNFAFLQLNMGPKSDISNIFLYYTITTYEINRHSFFKSEKRSILYLHEFIGKKGNVTIHQSKNRFNYA